MATRMNTIRVPVNFGNPADIADATLTTIGTPTIYIAENSVTNPVTFVSALLYVAFQDTSTVTGATYNETRANCTLNGVTTTITELDDLTNTGENIGGIFGPLNFTTHFTTNFGTVTSRTAQTQVYFDVSTGTGLTTRGVYGWYEITYTYSDTEANRIKTIAFDLESPTGALTQTANTAFGTIPQLTGVGGWLNGYASPVIRHIWAEVRGNNGANNVTTNHTIRYSFNGTGTNDLPTRIAALATDTYQMFLIDLSSLTTSTTNTLDLWLADALSRYQHLNVTIYVSFEYVVSGTTRILNYIEIPINFDMFLYGIANTDRTKRNFSFLIPEPGTITQRNISANISYCSNGTNATFQIKGGSQASFRGYAGVQNVAASMLEFTHLLDARSASGSGITLARGVNNIMLEAYLSAGSGTLINGIIRVLYESDVPSQGIDTQNKMAYKIIREMNYAAGSTNIISAINFNDIPETNYYINAAYWRVPFFGTVSASMTGAVEVNSGEENGDGWIQMLNDTTTIDAELTYCNLYIPLTSTFRRYPTDPDTNKLDIEASRRWKLLSFSAIRFGDLIGVAYHSQTVTLSGTISGSSGGTVNIKVLNASTLEIVASTSRTGNGVYSVTLYDPITEYIVLAVESDALKGASQQAAAGSGFDINLSGGGSSATIGGRISIN